MRYVLGSKVPLFPYSRGWSRIDGTTPAPFEMCKTPVNNGIKLPTSTGEFTGFLNHQQYDAPQ